jgi:Zn-dependent protease
MRLRWTLRLGSVAGIEVAVHPSWLVIYALFAWWAAAAARLLETRLTERSDLLLGLVASLVLFASVVVHELSHALVARRLHMPIGNITLFLFGGVATILSEPSAPSDEIKMAAAGPLASFVLALVFFGAYALLDATGWLWGAVCAVLLCAANVMLAFFNLLPAFPSDGGRILRALLWAKTRSQAKATQTASAVSLGIAGALVALGCYFAFVLKEPRGLWTAMVAAFLAQAAFASARRSKLALALQSVPITDCMAPALTEIPATASVAAFLESSNGGGWAGRHPVMSDGSFVGLLSPKDAARVPAALRASTAVSAAMTPAYRMPILHPHMRADEVLGMLDGDAANYLPVFADGKLAGVVSLRSIVAALRRKKITGL